MDRFRQKIGPLPAWAWGLIIGGVVVVFLYVRNRSGAAAAAGSTATDASALSQDDAIDGAFGDMGSTSGSPGVTDEQADNLADTGSLYSNNAIWETKAVTWLSGQGASPLSAQRALEQYLAGEAITQDYRTKYVDPAVAHFGLPPDGTAGPVHVVANPVPKTTTTVAPPKTVTTVAPAPTKAAKPRTVSYTVQRGDTLIRIAQKYGSNPARIAKANGIHNLNVITVGQRLEIPA